MAQTVTVVEDEAFINKMYTLHLQSLGYEVLQAKNGEEAIASLDETQPNLLILDLLMPKVDGFAVLKHIQDKGYSFPVIILSNLSQETDIQRCKELGAVDYFIKSDMDLDDLANKVQLHLN